ncbi:MAG: EAL domain-containing protein [Phenylobacterium sp.]|uniref:EAL domain-containing protein n=1 Tax=Phenylobacterium sp. TaxID=1871053 RepID=UPI0027324FBB|nr:EAL domain-containing protein [Phenylobacterium sp.]MDP3175714.1 EAL domain-containing protein [Phenylobacterium sp.]
MSLGAHRLLGFAFAGADLLLEIGPSGSIDLAVGASEALSGSAETQLVGRPLRDFIDARDQPMVDALFDALQAGARAGPVLVELKSAAGAEPRAATLRACRLPQNGGATSCTLSRAGKPAPRNQSGLHDKAGFETLAATLFETARATGVELELALVEMAGFAQARCALAPDAAKDAERRMAGLLRAQSHGGSAAAELGGDRYALVRQRTAEAPGLLAKRMADLLDLPPPHTVDAGGASLPLDDDPSAGKVLRAIRFSLDSFIRDGLDLDNPMTLGEAVQASLRRTMMEAGALGEAVARKNFRLVYQPVVDLKAGGALHHYEVLVRFGAEASPFPIIRMAEELDLIEPLDLAILERTVERLTTSQDLTLAVNISGRTICSSDFVEQARRIIRGSGEARHRLIFELTESAAIDDLGLADRHLQALRAEGCRVCLDDFGAGAASLAYLQQLSLDVVKIDGRYIRELQHGGRGATFIRHLVRMCAELGVKTLAEMVETPQAEEAVRRAGVDFAQGWLYGSAADEPALPLTKLAAPVSPGRRRGAVESWG